MVAALLRSSRTERQPVDSAYSFHSDKWTVSANANICLSALFDDRGGNIRLYYHIPLRLPWTNEVELASLVFDPGGGGRLVAT